MKIVVEALSDQISRLQQSTHPETVLKAELLEALRLADLYDCIKPQEYVLPLDALAGFIVTSK